MDNFDNIYKSLKEERHKLLQEELSKNTDHSSGIHLKDNSTSEETPKPEQDKIEIINPIFTDKIEPEIEKDRARIVIYNERNRLLVDNEYYDVELVFDPKLNLDPIRVLVLDVAKVSELLIFGLLNVKIGSWQTLEILCRKDKNPSENNDARMFQPRPSDLIMEVYEKYGINNKLKFFFFIQNSFG